MCLCSLNLFTIFVGSLGIPYQEGFPTSEMLLFFNDLFDSVNGQASKVDAKKQLTYMRFVSLKERERMSLSLQNYKVTIQSFEKLYRVLKTYNVRTLKTRHINLDVIEHFFGKIRSCNYRNINSSPHQFSNTYKTLLLNNLTSYMLHTENIFVSSKYSKPRLVKENALSFPMFCVF